MEPQPTIDWTKRRVWSEKQIIAELAALRAGQGPKGWGLAIEQEVKRRIDCAVAAYAYEVASNPLMEDAAWDVLAQTINPKLGTCHPMLDEFFATRFSPMTGMWIHDHPELSRIQEIYEARNENTGKFSKS